MRSFVSPLSVAAPARVVRLRGYGNCINPYVAKEFVQAYREARGLTLSPDQAGA